MVVMVDGKPYSAAPGPAPNLLSALVSVNNDLRKAGRAILSLKLDGEGIRPETLVERLQSTPSGQDCVLEIASEDVKALVSGSLAELDVAVRELPRACHELATVFQSKQPEDGYEPFHRLADLWGQVKSRELMVANALELPLESLELKGVSIAAHHEALNGFLEEAAEALEARDCVLLGDLLEYELAPRAETEAQIVAVLKEHAARESTRQCTG